jgi:hypothetical protein
LKRLLSISGLAALSGVAVYCWWPMAAPKERLSEAVTLKLPPPLPAPLVDHPTRAVAPATPAPSPAETLRRPGGSPLAAELNLPGNSPQRDVDVLHALLREYLHHLHHRQGLPIGDDVDLGRVLSGHNPMKLAFLPKGASVLSTDGHLRDRWGTPYFIHARGGNAFEVRSAGPDRRMFTEDDLIAEPASGPDRDEPE